VTSKAALSLGWSLHGKNRCIAFGWPASAVPSRVLRKEATPTLRTFGDVGVAVKCRTPTVNRWPRARGRLGVMASS
jgi:hypothetical protein